MEKGKELINETIRFLMTGTLSYGANADGIEWLLENARKYLPAEIHGRRIDLIIAGAHPREKLANQFRNVRLADTPPDMSPFFEESY